MTHQIDSTSKNDAMQDTRLTLDMLLSLIRLHVEAAGLEKYKTARSQSCRHGKANQYSLDDTWPRALCHSQCITVYLSMDLLHAHSSFRIYPATIKNLAINLQVLIPTLASHRLEILNMSIYQGFSSHPIPILGQARHQAGPNCTNTVCLNQRAATYRARVECIRVAMRTCTTGS